MDTLFPYRLIEAIRRTLDRAGEEPFLLFRAEDPGDWFHLGWLQDFLDHEEHREIPLLWEDGRTLPPTDSLEVASELPGRGSYRLHRTGSVLIRREALIAAVLCMNDLSTVKTFAVLGEREPGALRRLRDEYDRYAHRRSRDWPCIYVVGGRPLSRPARMEWDELIVPPPLGADLRRQVDTFFDSKEAYARLRLPHRRGILLTGPPGNGKTTAIRIIASRRPEPFFIFSLTDEAERDQIDDAFDRALYDAPSILCFEDVDSLFEKPGTLSHFLNRLDGLHPCDGILLLATTNHPEKLDAALTRRPSRFDRVYVLGNPAPQERRRYLGERLGAAFDERLVRLTEGFSLAQLKEVWVSASLETVETGGPGPTPAAALRAVDRVRGQKEAVETDWDHPQTIGFQLDRLRGNRGAPS